MGAAFLGIRHQGIGSIGDGTQYWDLTKHQRRRWPEGRQSAERLTTRERLARSFTQSYSAVDVQGAMHGVMAIARTDYICPTHLHWPNQCLHAWRRQSERGVPDAQY